MVNIFELLDYELNELQNQDLLYFSEVMKLLDDYRAHDSEVENLMLEIDTWDDKAQRAFERMKKHNEDTIEYKENKKKFEQYVQRVNHFNFLKNGILQEMSEIRKKAEELSQDWNLVEK